MATGNPIPPSIAEAPDLWNHNILFWNGFTDLVNSRTVGMEVGPIPWHCIYAYCQAYELDDEQTEDMLYFVHAMDVHQLNLARDSHAKKIAKDQAKPKQRQPRQPR